MTKVDRSKCIVVLCENPYWVQYKWIDTDGTHFKPEHARALYDAMQLTRCVVTMHHNIRTYTVGENFVDGSGVTYYGPDMTRVIKVE